MTPQLLAEYLKVMREAGLMSAALTLPWQFAEGEAPASLHLNVVFGPDTAPLPGDQPEPGGWKGPAGLDAEFKPGDAP